MPDLCDHHPTQWCATCSDEAAEHDLDKLRRYRFNLGLLDPNLPDVLDARARADRGIERLERMLELDDLEATRVARAVGVLA